MIPLTNKAKPGRQKQQQPGVVHHDQEEDYQQPTIFRRGNQSDQMEIEI